MINDHVVTDPVGPGGKLILKIIFLNDHVNLDKKILSQLHGNLFIPHHAVYEVEYAFIVTLHQVLKRCAISLKDLFDQFLIAIQYHVYVLTVKKFCNSPIATILLPL